VFDGFWEIARIFRLIVAVWFGLVGWKLVESARPRKS
jgi:hypothetical protein